ncbi:MAG TPA: NAD(P)H-binding protein [Candidatus Limnocylindrales bacterium]|nr:NAD(P)H-binding protein [Candidatus Limnocylindrales bacterium]
MKLAVIGASGRTGRILVEQALAEGHEVRAAIHRYNPFKPTPGLTPVQCNGRQIEDVEHLLDGCEAVVSLIGHGWKSPAQLQTDTIRNVLGAMELQHINRIISLTGTGVRMPGDSITLIDRLMNLTIRLIGPKRIRDGIQHVRVLQESDTQWTVVRVLKLANFRTAQFRLSLHGPAKTFVPRADVALAILEVLDHASYVGQMPIIASSQDLE